MPTNNVHTTNLHIRPVIKWSGSKRSQAGEILNYIPAFARYYEPFVGGGSIAYALRTSTGVCGDICEPLIGLWRLIKDSPEAVAAAYETRWNRLQAEGHPVYYEIRDRFNETGDPLDLLFLSRTCVNGLIRFNRDGAFNNSLHHTRRGISPATLRAILLDWAEALGGIDFRTGDYRATTEDVAPGDFVYLDPPYFNTRGRYYGTIDYDEFLAFLERLCSRGIRYALSFDGRRGDSDYSVDLPKSLYKRHVLLASGNSSFKKVMDKKAEPVYESLYLNWA